MQETTSQSPAPENPHSPPVAPAADLELAHLHVHTEYSLLDGAIRIPDLLKRVQSLGHKAVAITDHGNMFGVVELYLKAKDKGIKAILGSEIFHAGTAATGLVAAAKYKGKDSTLPAPAPPQSAYHLVLLAKHLAGYKNLLKAVSDGYLLGLVETDQMPIVPEASLAQYGDGLIALSACMRGEFGFLVSELRRLSGPGPLDFAADVEAEGYLALTALREHVRVMQERFGADNYFIELIDNSIPEQRQLLPDLVAAATYFALPLVASADAHYVDRDKADGHAVLLGIKHGLTMSKIRGRRKGTRFHLFDNAEMQQRYGAWPSSLTNIKRIVDQCNVTFEFGKYYLPRFDTGRPESPEEAMTRLAKEGLIERFVMLRQVYGPKLDQARESFYWDRLAYETGVICKMGFASYFLIVQDFINWAKQNGIPVGPGRGSGAGSLVAYALRITDLDPLPYNLLFERFLNPERVSMPDFDVDFCQDRRDEVIKYVAAKYGNTNVAQITTFGKMNAKAVVRDVGRVLELGYGRVDRIAKLIPDDIGITLAEAIQREPRIAEEAGRDEMVADLLRLARELEGLARHCSVHAAGVVISDGPMTDYVPVYTVAAGGALITQFEMKMAEKVGLVKFDFLGLKTLTVIEKAVEFIRKKKQPNFDIALIPMEDKRVYQMISSGHTVGIFQLESSGMRNLVVKLKPSCFDDIIALVALFRPGPLGSGMVDDFIECKHGRKPIVYPLPQLESILKETYGVMLYQEQVMKVAGELASYSLGEADLLRRAMGKKIAAEMAKQKTRFLEGAATNGHDPVKASEIFDLMAKFADYGFNKSHSAAYGLVSYQTAFLKCHFPEEFMAAIMTCDLDNTAKITRYVDDCRRLRIKILPPDINRSLLEFNVVGEKGTGNRTAVDFGLAAIKGIGTQALEPLLAARACGGPFKTLAELARRVNLPKVGKKTLELLTQAGALDGFGVARPRLCEVIAELVKFSDALHAAKGSGQRGLFDMEDQSPTSAGEELGFDIKLSVADRRVGAPSPEWLKKEKALLGVYLTGHPLHFHREDKRAFGRIASADLIKVVGKRIAMVAVFAAVNERLTKTGKRMASVRLEDEDGAVEAVMFESELPPTVADFPPTGTVVVATGSVDKAFDGEGVRFRLERVVPVEDLRTEHVRSATLRLTPPAGARAKPAEYQPLLAGLKRHFDAHRGDTPIKLVVAYGDADVMVCAKDLEVDLRDSFLHGFNAMDFAATEIRYQLFGTSGAGSGPQQ